MAAKSFSDGTVHKAPADFKKSILSSPAAYEAWEDITPLARNEWICWVTSAKQNETQAKRMAQMLENLAEGKRRPCCWPGCPHREKTGKDGKIGKKDKRPTLSRPPSFRRH